MINNIKTFAKFLDQPLLISKLNKTMPQILLGAGCLITSKNAYDVFVKNKNPDEQKQKENQKLFLKNTLILFASSLGAIIAPKIASKITNRTLIPDFRIAKIQNKKIIDEFFDNESNKDINPLAKKLLKKSKDKILSFKEVKYLIDYLNKNNHSDFINKLIPDPENVSSHDIFSEIGYLSIYGAIPVITGVASGIAVDKVLPDKENNHSTSDKISEGLYQYLANIFLCNVGAGAALGILEKLKITNKQIRALAMIGGIISTGVLGGSKIANFITQKVISPVFKSKIKERKPEIIDLGMHTDDIATVATLSGLKWIEPSLPFLYALSGYKSGIGYRN